MKAPYLPGRLLSAAILISVLLAAFTVSAEESERITETTHYGPGGRDARVAIKTSKDTQSESVSKVAGVTAMKNSSQTASAINQDFWFYSADVVLFGDADFDGYYSGIDLLFDADTIFSVADVYAVVFLSFEGREWEEYAVTEDFRIFGATSTDDYSVVTDLVAGFPTGEYDILIELYDAFNDDYLAVIGPEDTSELSFLPLEDIDRDTPFGDDTTVVVNTEGGGSASILLIALLSLAVLMQRGRRRS